MRGENSNLGMALQPSTRATHFDLGQVQAGAGARLALLRELVAQARADLERLMGGRAYLSPARRWALWGQLAPLEFRDYQHAVKRFDTLRRELRAASDRARHPEAPDDRPLLELGPEVERLVGLFDRERHTPDAAGYVAYIEDVCPAVLAHADRVEKAGQFGGVFPETEARLHTHVLGGRGSGKSELLKLLIHHYVRHPELGAVVVIDPHNDLVRHVSRWREFESNPERLVYLDGSLSRDHLPALNPLYVEGYEEQERANFAVLMADAIGALSSTRTLTDNMRTLARSCLRIVLEESDGATLEDLAGFVSSGGSSKGHPLLERAKAHPDLGRFFRDRFTGASLLASREGLADRLDNVLTLPRLGKILRMPEPLDLEGMISAGKVILIGLAGGDGGDELGRLMLARVAMVGWRRLTDERLPRTPVNVFVDEAHRLIGPTTLQLMQELRKTGLRLTLAHQALSQISDASMRDTLWSAAGVKIFGASDERDALEKVAPGAARVPQYQFAIRWGMKSADEVVMLTNPRADLRDGANDMHPDAYRDLVADQVRRYYRPIAGRGSAGAARPGNAGLPPKFGELL